MAVFYCEAHEGVTGAARVGVAVVAVCFADHVRIRTRRTSIDAAAEGENKAFPVLRMESDGAFVVERGRVLATEVSTRSASIPDYLVVFVVSDFVILDESQPLSGAARVAVSAAFCDEKNFILICYESCHGSSRSEDKLIIDSDDFAMNAGVAGFVDVDRALYGEADQVCWDAGGEVCAS